MKTNNNCNTKNYSNQIHIDLLNEFLEQEISNLDGLNKLINEVDVKLNKRKLCIQKEQTIYNIKDVYHNVFSPSMSQNEEGYQEAYQKALIDIQNDEDNLIQYKNNKVSIERKIDGINNLVKYLISENKMDNEDCFSDQEIIISDDEVIITTDDNVDITDKEVILTDDKAVITNKEVIVMDEDKSNSLVSDNCTKDVGLQLLEMQEMERKRIARDLHDSTVQNLTMMVHKAELCLKLANVDLVRMKLELQTLISSIKNSIDDIRNIIYDLRPMSIDDLGLVVTVERFIYQVSHNQDINIKLEVNVQKINLLPVINLTLLRIIQEACNNALKHAKAKNITISIYLEQKYLKVIIQDDGVGFNKDELEKSEGKTVYGLGLSIMKERVYLLSGEIDIDTNIESDSNIGTKIMVKVPLCIE